MKRLLVTLTTLLVYNIITAQFSDVPSNQEQLLPVGFKQPSSNTFILEHPALQIGEKPSLRDTFFKNALLFNTLCY